MYNLYEQLKRVYYKLLEKYKVSFRTMRSYIKYKHSSIGSGKLYIRM